jgi:NADH-quinone oxidoreductase subunit D
LSEEEKERREVGAGLMEYSPENLVPFGPVHPSLKEPEYFKLILEGEKIVEVHPRIGYVHRGIERAAQDRTWVKNIYLFERICGICSFAHSLAYTEGTESLTEFQIPVRAKYLRVLIAELERIHSHLLWLGLVGYWTGFDTLFMWIWKDREHVLDLLEAITGNRVHKSFSTLGGVRKDLTPALVSKLEEETKFITERVKYYETLVHSEETLVSRTRGVGRLTKEIAERLCPVGPLLRCSGIDRDVRKEDPYAAYEFIQPEVKTSNAGDIESLLSIRLAEVTDSCRMISEALDRLPEGPVRVPFPRIIPRGDAFFHVEAPRGELFYFIRSNGTPKPERVKIRTPTLANLLTAAEMLKGRPLADVPVVLTGIDPCFGCMDRVTVIDVDKSKKWSVSGEELRVYGIEYYRRGAGKR